jgi:hypothetical protein
MAFELVRFLPVQHRYVTMASNHLTFKQRTLAIYGLQEYDYVELGVDPALHRLYFRFHQWEAAGALPFRPQRQGGTSRRMPIRGLCARYDWIASTMAVRELRRRTFLVEDTMPGDNVPEGFDHYITVEHVRFKGFPFKPKYFPRAGGIYWLRNEYGDVVRIGESDNMASHIFRQGQSLGSKIVTFDYEIIENQKQRLSMELEYIEDYSAQHGVPPPLNPILLTRKKGPRDASKGRGGVSGGAASG